jgi:hypothetical protein
MGRDGKMSKKQHTKEFTARCLVTRPLTTIRINVCSLVDTHNFPYQ